MKKGFTMIELIFVIVILGILAAVAIPRLAATRDDAKAASIKTDIGTAMQAVPAWYQGQKQASFLNAMSLDTNVWKKQTNCVYQYEDDAGGTISMSIKDNNGTGDLTNCDVNASSLTQPVFLMIELTPAGSGIVYDLNASMGVHDANVTLGGKRVQW